MFRDMKAQLDAVQRDLRELDDRLGRFGAAPNREFGTKRRFSDREERPSQWDGPPKRRFTENGRRDGPGTREPGRRMTWDRGVDHRGKIYRHGPGMVDDVDEAEGQSSVQREDSTVPSDNGPTMRRPSNGLGGKDTARNRRMFGALLGTLKTFQKDSQKSTQVEEKRKDIQQRVEEKMQKESEQATLARRKMIGQRKAKLDELAKLRHDLAMARIHMTFIQHNRGLAPFIMLKSEPKIFFLPGKHNKATLAMLEESRRETLEKYPEVPDGDMKAADDLEHEHDNLAIDGMDGGQLASEVVVDRPANEEGGQGKNNRVGHGEKALSTADERDHSDDKKDCHSDQKSVAETSAQQSPRPDTPPETEVVADDLVMED